MSRLNMIPEFASQSLIEFIVTAAVIEITPGPNMAYLAALSLSQGRRAGAAAVVGIALGLALCGAAAAFGLATIVDRSPIVYELLRWGGVAYLLYLAWEGWRQESGKDEPSAEDITEQPRTAFRRGLIVNLLNPKAAVFYIAVLPEFIKPAAPSVLGQTLTLSAIYVAIATVIHLAIVFAAGSLQSVIATPENRRGVRRALSLALVVIAVWFAFSTDRN